MAKYVGSCAVGPGSDGLPVDLLCRFLCEPLHHRVHDKKTKDVDKTFVHLPVLPGRDRLSRGGAVDSVLHRESDGRRVDIRTHRRDPANVLRHRRVLPQLVHFALHLHVGGDFLRPLLLHSFRPEVPNVH